MVVALQARTTSTEPPSFVPFEAANLVAIWVEVLLYGVYSCLFFESLYIIYRKRKTRTLPGKIFLLGIIQLYMVATAHICVNLIRLIHAFVHLDNTSETVFYLFDIKRWETIVHYVCLCLMTWTGDALVIYRCFIVWDNNYLIVLPSVILLVASIVINVIYNYWMPHPFSIPFSHIIALVNSNYPLNLVQNTMTTGLIAFKIWTQYQASRQAGLTAVGPRMTLTRVGWIIIESALIYTSQLLILIILYFTKQNAQLVVLYSAVPTIGIVFSLIAVRVHLTTSETLQITNDLLGNSNWTGGIPALNSNGTATTKSDCANGDGPKHEAVANV